MTREQILAMEVGRELNAVIDKEIFGGDGCVHDLYWVDPEEYACAKCHKQFCSPEPYDYSADILAAWQVWEKMKVSGFWAKFIKAVDSLSPTESYMPLLSLAETINPENICKAALLTKLTKPQFLL